MPATKATDPKAEKPPRRRLPVWKRLAFASAAAAIFLGLLELVLWACGVRPAIETEDPFVGFSASVPLFVERPGPDGTAVLVTAENKLPSFNRQQFPRDKADGTYRIFCLGGSTTYGRPYSDATSFAGWLRELLPAADPAGKWEVVNAGGISYASYRVANLAGELARYDPDLFIVYCGHNEFLERRTYGEIAEMSAFLRETSALLARTRTYSAMRGLIGRITGRGRRDARRRYELTGEVEEILAATSGPTSYTRDDALREKVLLHYRYSLGRIARTARAAGARVIFIPPPSNLKDCSPFKSENRPGLSGEARARWSALFRRGVELAEAGRHAEALGPFRSAIAIDPRHAGLRFGAGRALLALERFDQARTELLAARDEDVCPLRAVSSMRRVVLEVAAESDAAVVDFTRLLEAESRRRNGHSILGDDDFLDHVHPTIDTHRRLALALIDKLAEMGVVTFHPGWDAAAGAVAERLHARIDRRAHARALHNLAKVINWAGKHDQAARIAARALRDLPEHAGSLLIVGASLERAGKTAPAIDHYRRAVRLAENNPQARRFLAAALVRAGDLPAAERHYLVALRLDPDNAQTHNALGNIHLAAGRVAKAVRHHTRAARLDPDNPDNHYNLALALIRAGRDERAAGSLRRVIRLSPRDADAHNQLGALLARRGLFAEAVKHFSRALQIRPDFAEARRNFSAALRHRPATTRPQ